MQSSVSYIQYTTSSKDQTDDLTMLAQFEEGILLLGTCDDTEIGNVFDDDSNIAPLISEALIDARSPGDEYYDEHMSTDMLKDICDGSQYHPRINRREAGNKIRDSL